MTDHRTIYKSKPPPPVIPKLPTARERRMRLKERARIAAALLFAGSLLACGGSDDPTATVVQTQMTCTTCGSDGTGAQRYESKDGITATVDGATVDIVWSQDAVSYIATVKCASGHQACFEHPVEE